jgi:UDP-N-acetylmuramate dehydrogenase
MNIENILIENGVEYKKNILLKDYTTIGVGGRASYLLEIKKRDVLENAVNILMQNNIPFVVLGNGSNVIISDEGFSGVVIINKTETYKIIKEKVNGPLLRKDYSRLDQTDLYDNELNSKEFCLVKVDSGMSVIKLTQKLYKEKISGLEWFAGIPASVGGAVYMNMHGGKHFFGNLVYNAKILSEKGFKIVDKNYFKFDYDYSILQTTKEILIWVELCLPKGRIEQAQYISKSWAKEKSYQPQKSAGCVFRNITEEEKKSLNLPSVSIGYLIDKVLNLKGYQIGGAKISEKHAAFIENKGDASAKDVYNLVEYIKKEAAEKLKLKLETEIEFIGNF